MDDMDAFERQVARDALQDAGPSQPVAAAAVFARAIPVRSPASRFQHMISATKLVTAGAIVALFGGLLLAGVVTQQRDEPILPAAKSASPRASAAPRDAATYDVTRIKRPPDAWPALATSDSLWLADHDGGIVYRVDAQSGETTTIELEMRPAALLSDEDAIWVVGDAQVLRIDRSDLTLSQDPIMRGRGAPFAWSRWLDDAAIIADGSLWIAAPGSEGDTLVEIDLATRAIRDEYPVDGFWWGDGEPPWMVAIDDAIWVYANGQLTRFDLPARAFTDRIEVPVFEHTCCFAGDDAIWLRGEEGNTLLRFDTDTLEVTDELELGGSVRGGIAAADGMWIATSGEDGGTRAVHRIDPRTREVTDVIPVSRAERLVMFDGALWAGAGGMGRTLSYIDIGSREVVGTIDMPASYMETAPLVSDAVMWVQTHDTGALFRVERAAAAE